MDLSVEQIAERILTRKIDKQDAIREFNQLPEEEKNRLVDKLKTASAPGATPGDEAMGVATGGALKSVHEFELTVKQKKYLETLTKKYKQRVAKSRNNALIYHTHFADRRNATGLNNALKSTQFQLTYDSAEGAWLYDIDGNKYIDITGDNGVNFFGHQPEFIKTALKAWLEQGYPLMGYSEDLFKAAELFCELTGHERMVFAQTATEAVMWAIRIARAATRKNKIVIFDGSYHGLFDTLPAMRGRNGSSLPPGLGLLQEFADQLIILEHGDMDQLSIIEMRANEIACVLCEPVQSRFPARQPHAFLQKLRAMTLEYDIALIFDEIVTGFRAGPKGAEGFFKVKPDITIYGEVPGGGMPGGIVAGLAKYMNYVDGGVQGGDDDAMPGIKKTLMAGMHEHNSLKVSATLAVCQQMKNLCQREGGCDYLTCTCDIGKLNQKTSLMCQELNTYFQMKNVPLIIEYFSSQFCFFILDDLYGIVRDLLIILLRLDNIETSPSGNCFLTLAHSDDDIRQVVNGFKRAVDELTEHQFFYYDESTPLESPAEMIIGANITLPAEKSQSEQLKEKVLEDLRNIYGKED